eukprot:TRINITY_DN13378_c0_g2_i3.p2 TRINITY_DN13378_c0_g2~~TRINITY_DN13378_c0_g2_i3.p2  ORF type:complete len:334 (-),score=74.00 TRINITY_DN13378_c0_g2_i3:278-1279(-)
MAMGLPGSATCKMVTLAAMGLAFLVLFVRTASSLASPKPIYIPMMCNTSEQNVGKEQIDAQHGASVKATATTVCRNSNPFTFLMEPIEASKLYLVLGDDVSQVGNVTVDPQTIAPHASVRMPSNVSMYFSSTQTRHMLDYHRSHGEPMMMSVSHVWGAVQLDLYGWKLRSPWEESKSYCAWSINPRKRLNGPIVCDKDLRALQRVVKPANASIEPFAVYVDPEKIAQAERARHWFFSLVMAVSLAIVVAAMLRCRVHWQAHSRRIVKAGGDDLQKAEEGRLEQQAQGATCYLPSPDADERKEVAQSVATVTTQAPTPRASAASMESIDTCESV